jgi:hypothetical protein
MPWDTITLGLLLLVPLGLNGAFARGELPLTMMVAAFYVLSVMTDTLMTLPGASFVYLAMDVLGAVLAFEWFTRKRQWALILGALFVAQVSQHFAFWTAIAIGREPDYSAYLLSLNVLYVPQIIALSWPGGIDGFRRLRRLRLRSDVCRALVATGHKTPQAGTPINPEPSS